MSTQKNDPRTEDDICRENIEKAEQYFAKESHGLVSKPDSNQTNTEVQAKNNEEEMCQTSPTNIETPAPISDSKTNTIVDDDSNVIVTRCGKFYQKFEVFPKQRHIPNLFIKDQNGTVTIYRDMFTTDTIEDLINKIANSKRVSLESVKISLTYNGQNLTDYCRTLGEYGICSDSTVIIKAMPLLNPVKSKCEQSDKPMQSDQSTYFTRYGRTVKPNSRF